MQSIFFLGHLLCSSINVGGGRLDLATSRAVQPPVLISIQTLGFVVRDPYS